MTGVLVFQKELSQNILQSKWEYTARKSYNDAWHGIKNDYWMWEAEQLGRHLNLSGARELLKRKQHAFMTGVLVFQKELSQNILQSKWEYTARESYNDAWHGIKNDYWMWEAEQLGRHLNLSGARP